MEFKQLGTSSVKVTPIAFGAWAIGGWMWGGAEDEERSKLFTLHWMPVLRRSTPPAVYGFGKKRGACRPALQGVGRDKYQILTKYGMNWQPRRENIILIQLTIVENP
jgi:aryl-alcohol dehydrogenase-like predicted oxidoreductase